MLDELSRQRSWQGRRGTVNTFKLSRSEAAKAVSKNAVMRLDEIAGKVYMSDEIIS